MSIFKFKPETGHETRNELFAQGGLICQWRNAKDGYGIYMQALVAINPAHVVRVYAGDGRHDKGTVEVRVVAGDPVLFACKPEEFMAAWKSATGATR